MLRLKVDSKLQRATPKMRSSASIYQSWAKASPPPKHCGRYAVNEAEGRHTIEHEGGRSVAVMRPQPITTSINVRRGTRSRDNLKSLEVRPDHNKNTSPNYNDLKRKRMLREQHRHQQIQSKNRSTQPQSSISGRVMQPICAINERHTTSAERINGSIGELVEQGALDEHAIKQYITELQHVLVAIKQKQHSERSGRLVDTTVKKKMQATERKDASTSESVGGSVRRILFRPANVRRTIDSDTNDGSSSKPACENRGASESSMKDTQHLRQETSKPNLHTNLLSLVINRTKQQRKMLNLIEVRERYKLEKSHNSNSKASGIEETAQKDKNEAAVGSSREEYSSRGITHSRKVVAQDQLISVRQPSKTIDTTAVNCRYKPIIHPKAAEQLPASVMPIEQEDSKVQISNFSSPLQLPKRQTKPDLQKLNLDLSEINNRNVEAESIDSAKNLFENEAEFQQQRLLDRLKSEDSRLLRPADRPKKKLIDIDRWKKNFPVGFFDLEA